MVMIVVSGSRGGGVNQLQQSLTALAVVRSSNGGEVKLSVLNVKHQWWRCKAVVACGIRGNSVKKWCR